MTWITNVVGLALGLVLATVLGMILRAGVNFVSPYKTFEHIKDLPAFHLNQDYSQKEFPALIRIETPATRSEEQQFECSGTVISDDYVVTAAHCVGGMEGKLSSDKVLIISLANQAGETLTVEAIPASMNARADYALIKGDFTRFTKMRVLKNLERGILEVIFGQRNLVTCGFPWGASDMCYPTSPTKEPYMEYIMMQGLLYPGMSGGPVVDTASGIVVAVNTGIEGGKIFVAPLVGLFETLKVQVVP